MRWRIDRSIVHSGTEAVPRMRRFRGDQDAQPILPLLSVFHHSRARLADAWECHTERWCQSNSCLSDKKYQSN